MANEIQVPYGVTGATLYAVVGNSVAQIWRTTLSTFVTFNGAEWTDYDIPLTEQGTSGVYVGDFPAASAGVYGIVARVRAGGSPAQSDLIAGAGAVEWDGTAVLPLSALTPQNVWLYDVVNGPSGPDTAKSVLTGRASPADVNAQVLDVLSVDTFPEPTGTPAATTTLADKIGRNYQALRNRITVTSSAKTFYSDAGAALWAKALSDDGATYSEAEGA